MAQKAPGKHYRTGLSLMELAEMFPDNAAAEARIAKIRWPNGARCPHCSSDDVQEGAKHPSMPYRCRSCRKFFSVRTGTVMQNSNLGAKVWVWATYLLSTNLKGVSSMKLHRDLHVTQKTAWHLAHRIRETWKDAQGPFSGPVEVDETYMGGKEKNRHGNKKKKVGRGVAGKTPVVGMKDRDTNAVSAVVVARTDQATRQGFVLEQVHPETKIYTDDHRSYDGLPNHESVKHSVGNYLDGMAHTNGIESFWAMLKRGYHGTYHKMSDEHLGRYVNEFSGRHNQRKEDTLAQMIGITQGLVGKRLRYRDLVAYNPSRQIFTSDGGSVRCLLKWFVML